MHMFCKWLLNMSSSPRRLRMQISSMGLEIAQSRSPDRPEARRRCIGRRTTATAPWRSGSWRPAPRSTLATRTAAASELISASGRGRWAKAQRKETLETRGFGSGEDFDRFRQQERSGNEHVFLRSHSKI